VDDATGTLVHAQDELVMKRATLQRRLADIYKRGPLYSLEALLSAQSFGELVARYKYLHQLARRDRALVRRVEELRNRISAQRGLLVSLQSAVEQNRAEKADEELRLRTLEQQRQKSLAEAQRRQKQTEARLAQISRDEARLAQTIASLEAARVRADARRPAGTSAPSLLRTADLGKLDWPVDGEVLYKFGRVVNPNNTTTRWNGIGIHANQGTPVKAIAEGDVAIAEPFGTYGLTVIVQHGAGDYSVYGSLQRMDVKKGAHVLKGQVIGAVGAADPDLPPHLHFEIRRAKGGAVDPLDWLRAQR
jgi:septal ring factor EnvC (AmiA/AmiB activator)